MFCRICSVLGLLGSSVPSKHNQVPVNTAKNYNTARLSCVNNAGLQFFLTDILKRNPQRIIFFCKNLMKQPFSVFE